MVRTGSARALVVAVLTGLAACGRNGDRERGVSVRDSAGTRIVEHALIAQVDPVWSIGTTPLAEIGGVNADEASQLFRVSGAARLADGRIVVANSGSHELRFFDASGRFLLASGREGAGPGEFGGLGPVSVVIGDSVVAYDWRLRRISVFDRTGRFARSYRPDLQHIGSPEALGAFANGTWLFTTSFTFVPSRISRVVRDTTLFVLVGRSGAVLDSLGRFPRVEFFVVGDERAARASSLPFGRTTEQAVSGRFAFVGSTDSYEVFRFTDAGELDLVIRREHEHLAVTSSDVDRYMRDRLDDAVNDDWRKTLERMFDDMPIPSTMPAFDRLQSDAQGNLWVLETRRPSDDEPRWTVYGLDGRIIGAVSTPTGLDVLEIGDDYMLGVWRDEFEVEHVRMYELVKP